MQNFTIPAGLMFFAFHGAPAPTGDMDDCSQTVSSENLKQTLAKQ